MSFKDKKQYRLPGHNYGDNCMYHVVLCAKGRIRVFGDVINDTMVLSELGTIARDCWQAIPDHFPYAVLDTFQIMPDHVHGIISISRPPDVPAPSGIHQNIRCRNGGLRRNGACAVPTDVGPGFPPGPQPKSIGIIIQQYKAAVTRWARAHDGPHTVWQSRFYDRLIRDTHELKRTRKYIKDNPQNWDCD